MKLNLLKKFLGLFFVMTLMVFSISCFGGDDGGDSGDNTLAPISTSDPEAVASAITIENGKVVTGSLPSSTGTNAPVINNTVDGIESSAGDNVQLPIFYTTSSKGKASGTISAIYAQIKGASSYWEITSFTTSSGYVLFKFTMPSNLEAGTFVMQICIKDSNSKISRTFEVTFTVTKPEECSGSGFSASGNEGLTSKSYYMGSSAGTVTLAYDTYSIPDRVDIYIEDKWVAGTGSDLGTSLPPIKDCDDVVSGDGFYGKASTLTVNYPGNNKKLTVYVSGCMNEGTAWEYTLSCPSGSGDDNTNTNSAPNTPTGLEVESASSTSLNISWDSVSGATGYYLYRSTSASTGYTKINTASTTSYTDTGRTTGTTYYYKVSAYNSIGESDKSSYVSGTPSASGTNTGTGTGSMSFSQNGTSFSSPSCGGVYSYGTTGIFSYSLTGASTRSINIYFPGTSTGTFTQSTILDLTYIIISDSSTDPVTQWYGASEAGGTSSITITKYDSSTIEGTFSGTLKRYSGTLTPDTLTITNGSFKAIRY